MSRFSYRGANNAAQSLNWSRNPVRWSAFHPEPTIGASAKRQISSTGRSSDNPIDIAAITESLSQSHSRFFGSIAMDTPTRPSIESSSRFTGFPCARWRGAPQIDIPPMGTRRRFLGWVPYQRLGTPSLAPAIRNGNIIGHAPGGPGPASLLTSYGSRKRCVKDGTR
jgi:hypothetical protein